MDLAKVPPPGYSERGSDPRLRKNSAVRKKAIQIRRFSLRGWARPVEFTAEVLRRHLLHSPNAICRSSIVTVSPPVPDYSW